MFKIYIAGVIGLMLLTESLLGLTNEQKENAVTQAIEYLSDVFPKSKRQYGGESTEVIDISYYNLVKFTVKPAIWSNIPQHIKIKIQNLGTIGEPFYSKVTPTVVVKRGSLFVIDQEHKDDKNAVAFIRNVFRAAILNPVGETRIKSLFLASYLIEANKLKNCNLPFTKYSGKQTALGEPIFEAVDKLKIQVNIEDDYNWEVIFNDLLIIPVSAFVNLESLALLNTGNDTNAVRSKYLQIKGLMKLVFQHGEIKGLEEYNKKTGVTPLAKEDILRGYNIIAISMIHELSHAYHKIFKIVDQFNLTGSQEKVSNQVRQYFIPMENKSVGDAFTELGGNKSLEVNRQKAETFWDEADELLTMMGFCSYYNSDEDKVYIIEDHQNENSARHAINEPYQIGHTTSKPSNVEKAINVQAFQSLLISYYDKRKIDINSSKMLLSPPFLKKQQKTEQKQIQKRVRRDLQHQTKYKQPWQQRKNWKH